MATDRRIFLLKAAVSAALLGLVLSRVDPAAVGAVFAGIVPWLFLPVITLYFVNTLISAWKWSLLLGADGFAIPFPSLVRSYLIGTFFNIFLPSSIGGDAYRVWDLSRRSSRTAEGFASVFADRLTGFLALSAWGLLFSLVGLSFLGDKSIVLLPLLAFIVLLSAVPVMLRWGRPLLALFRLDRHPAVMRFFDRMVSSADAYRTSPGLLFRAALLSLLFQFLVIFLVYLMGGMLRLGAPFLAYCMFVPLITLIEALPVSIYGMGVRDVSYVFFFTRAGATQEQALSLSLLFLLVSIFYAFTFGGVAFLTRRPPGAGGGAPP
jgi:uncharacterized protein (TIRG00374 family)